MSNFVGKNSHCLGLIQCFQALDTIPAADSWSRSGLYSDLCVQTVRRALSHLIVKFDMELKTLTTTGILIFWIFDVMVTSFLINPLLSSSFLQSWAGFDSIKVNIAAAQCFLSEVCLVLLTKPFSLRVRHFWPGNRWLPPCGDWTGETVEIHQRCQHFIISRPWAIHYFQDLWKCGFRFRTPLLGSRGGSENRLGRRCCQGNGLKTADDQADKRRWVLRHWEEGCRL